jgi:hypothetical protein
LGVFPWKIYELFSFYSFCGGFSFAQFFSDTAHNPETNQRPLQQQPQQQQQQQQQQVMYPSMSTMAPAATSTPTAVTTNRNYPLQQQQQMQQMHRNVAEKQESLYSTLQDFAVGASNQSPAGLG